MSEDSKLTLYVDGGARGNPGPAAAGVVLRNEGGTPLLEAGYLLGTLTNNQAEYSALVIGVRAARQAGAKSLTIYSDSELMVKQLRGEYRVKAGGLKPLFEDVQHQLLGLARWKTAQRRIVASGADVVLCGHDHQEQAEALEGAVVACAGTLSSRSRGARAPVFFRLVIDDDAISVEHYRWDADAGVFRRSHQDQFARRRLIERAVVAP